MELRSRLVVRADRDPEIFLKIFGGIGLEKAFLEVKA